MSPLGPHLLTLDGITPSDYETVFSMADSFAEVSRRAIPKVPALKGRTVVSLFAEDSTRTRLSFEAAARKLSADVMTFPAATSSTNKGESLRDTVETIAAMGADAFVVRHRSAGVPNQITRWVDAAVINAGDGAHQHPTQALLDCFTIRQALAQRAGLDSSASGARAFEGLRVGIVGDVAHSRVARSLTQALGTLGCRVVIVAPGSLAPPSLEGWRVEGISHSLDEIIGDLDVCYVLRLQTERGAGTYLPSLREYTATFGLTLDRASKLPPGALIMHPGPMVRGVEIASDVADLPNSLVLRQVANGVVVRMAVLFLLLGGERATLSSNSLPAGADGQSVEPLKLKRSTSSG